MRCLIQSLECISVKICHIAIIEIPIMEIRQFHDRLIFKLGIYIPGKMVFILKRDTDLCTT